MLAGTVYIYDENEKLIKELDSYDYDGMSEDAFLQMLKELNAYKAVLHAYYHNHHEGVKTVLYEKKGQK